MNSFGVNGCSRDCVESLLREAKEIRDYVLSGEADYSQAIMRIDEWRSRAAPFLEAKN